MTDDELRAAVVAERAELVDLLAALPADRWDAPTLCDGWRVREVVAHAGPSARVLGVGLCGHNDGLYAVDAGGRPVRPAILATDSRAHAESRRLSVGETGRRALELTGQVPSPASPARPWPR